MTKRKPHNDLAGYVAERKCHAPCGGHIVIYDRHNGFVCDADDRWIVMHEPSSLHVSVPTKAHAYDLMKACAAGEPAADILPEPEPPRRREPVQLGHATEMGRHDRLCTECGRQLSGCVAWLELDHRTNTYHDDMDVPPESSQGWFPFGMTCARRHVRAHRRAAG